jgi:trans-aconitate 2-methyltransferase
MDSWDPEAYQRFRSERDRPFFDLLALVQSRPGMRVVDLGCGTGALTLRLHQHLGAIESLGIDDSTAMLRESHAHASDSLRFQQLDIQDFAPAPRSYDLVFSNAALQWVQGHEALFERVTEGLRSGGQLAVQFPANGDHPVHVVAARLAKETPFREALAGRAPRRAVLPPEAYAILLERLGYQEQHVRLQVYCHRMPAREAVVAWVQGSLLRPYTRLLSRDLYARFLVAYRQELLARLPDVRPFLFTVKRLLIWGMR